MTDSPSVSGPDPASSPDEASPSALRRWGRRVLWGLGGLVGTAVLLAGLVLLVLQTETGATAAAQFLARQFNPMPNTTLTVDRASGSWVRSLRLTNVSLARPDSASASSTRMAHVDTLAVQYRLGALLHGRLHLTAVSLSGPSVTMRQAPDSSWDWVRLAPIAKEAPDDTSAGMPIQIDRLRLTDGRFAADFYAEGRDSTARVHDLDLRAEALEFGPSIGGRLDTLGLRGQLPADTTDLRLAARGALSSSRLQIDTLRLTSPRSDVRGHGVARLPVGPYDTLDDVALSLRATPLVLGDLTAFAPTLAVDPREAIDLEARLTGSGQRLSLTTEARVRDGGRLTVEAEATPRTETIPEGPPLHYQLDADLRRLATSLIGTPDSAETTITASVDGTLEGPALDALNGSMQAEITDSRLYGVPVSEVALQSTVKDGTAEVDLNGTLNGIGLSVDGTARPFDAAPSADLSTQVRDLSLATVAPDAGIDGTITATAQFTGQSLTTDSARYELDATLADSRVGAQVIESGRFSAALGPDQLLRADGALRFPTGRMQVAGQAALDGSERFVLDTARVDDVNVAALMGDTTASRATAALRGEGQGFSPTTMEGRATLTIQDARYGPHRMSSLSTEARLDEGRLTAEADARLHGSEWSLSASGRPFASVPVVEVTNGRVRRLDVGPFLQDTTQSSALQGSFRGRVQGTTPETLQLDTRLTLDTSRINRQEISEASLEATIRDSTLQSALMLDTPQGGTQLTMEARPFDATPRYDVSDATFDDLDLGALAGMSGLTTGLSGGLTFTARGGPPSDLALSGELTLRESTINRALLSEGRLEATTEQGRLEANGEFAVAGGSLRLRGHLDSLDHTPSYALTTTARTLDVDALAGLDSLQSSLRAAQWSVKGRGAALDSLSASMRFSADSVEVGELRADTTRVAGTVDGGLLRLDTLTVQSNAVEAQGQGTVALTEQAGASDFDLQATVTDAASLGRLAGLSPLRLQRGTVNAHVYGPVGGQQFDGTVELDGLIHDDVRLGDVMSSFKGQRGTDQLIDRFEVEVNAGYLAAVDLTATQTRLQATYDGTTVHISTDMELDSGHEARLKTSFQPTAEPLSIHLHQLTARLGPDQWSLARETSLRIGDAYRVDDLRLESGAQYIEVDGIVDPSGSQDFRASLEQVRLGGFAPLLGLSGLDGTATGQMSLGGAASAPTLDGTLDLALRSDEDDVGTLRLDVGYKDLEATLDARLTHRDGSELAVAGSVPADLRLQAPSPANVSDRPVRLEASTDGFPIDWVDPFFDSATLHSITGTLAADADIRGTLGQPELSGSASISDAGATLPTLETTYRNGTATLQLSDNQLTLESARVRTANGGSLRVNGLIKLPKLTVGEYDLTLDASDFLAIDTPAYRHVVVDGTMTLRGTVRRPSLTGDVQVKQGSVHYAEARAASGSGLSTVSLGAQDQLTLEERFGLRLSAADTTTVDTYAALAMDLNVGIQSDTWFRSTSTPEMNVQFTGNLDVQKEPDQNARVFGTIEAVESHSTLRQFGQEFQITAGTMTFNGDPAMPYLDLTAVYDQQARRSQSPEVRITLSLSGRPDDLSPSLSSEPPMSTRDILSYLATGRPADKLFTGGSEGGSLATQVALGQASTFVENLAASELGLDVVRLDVRTEGASYLTMGRYLTPRFFASIDQPILTPSSQSSIQSTALIPDVTLEYRLSDYLRLRSRSNQQSLQLNLLFEYAY